MTSSDTEDTVGNFVEQKRDAMSRTDVSASEHTRFIEDGEGETENSEAIQERSSWVDGVNERNMEEGGSRVRVVPAQGKCVRCAQRCEKMFSICLTSYHPLPPAPTWSDRCMFAVRCPPHGRVAQTLTLVMMAVLGWAALWAITKDDALPGGNLFALTVLLVLCVIGGRLIQRIKLPPLLGMLIVGILLRNVPGIMVGSWIDPVWASSIRLVALTVILIRAGLGLDPVQLRRLSWTVLLLAFLPCVVEASTLAVVIHFLLDFPWLWGFMLGFVLAAVSPAVVVPSMLWLQEVGLGVDQGIPTLVIASGSVDDVIAITGFAVCLGITFTTERSPQSAGVDGVGNRPIDDLWKQDSWVCRFRGPGLSGHGFCGRLQVEDGQGLGVAAIVIGSLVRMVASGVAVSGAGFTWKERLFVAIAWLPKATVQAAIGSTALDTARELTPQDTTNEKLGIQLLTIAVLVILITAPLGSALISLTARHLLRKSMREDLDRDSAIEMNNIGECAQEDDIELQAHPAEGQEQVSVQGKCDHNESV
ncbi:sodium/hydrogen exchanger 9B2-like isoform X8 [Branchiostoma lanceolatum]|uniref:sodium/hydrogen exchanger 9B2-like isoform X8 n=1 Tax=Branchiostoma lanceolatum TaxID=7740 RepID=UPI0034569627